MFERGHYVDCRFNNVWFPVKITRQRPCTCTPNHRQCDSTLVEWEVDFSNVLDRAPTQGILNTIMDDKLRKTIKSYWKDIEMRHSLRFWSRIQLEQCATGKAIVDWI